MIFIIYLASGNSKRFGIENKLLQNFNGKAIFKHGVDTLHAVSLRYTNVKILAVTKYLEIAEYCEALGIHTVYEEVMPNEISYTIKKGMQAVKNISEDDYFMFCVADQPFISEKTIESFIDSAKHNVLTAQAVCGDTRGNPVMFSAKLISELMDITGDIGGRVLLKKYPPCGIEVQSEIELKDVDKVECLTKLQTYL